MFPQMSRTFRIGNREVGWGCPIFMTAEIGAAHCGRFEDLLRMIRAAAEAGCDGADIFMADPSAFYYRAMSNGHDYIKDWHNLHFTDEQWAEWKSRYLRLAILNTADNDRLLKVLGEELQ